MTSANSQTAIPWTHRIWPPKYRPMLDAWLDIGLLQISTAVWREAIYNDCTDYLYLEFRVLRKWGFRVRLYDPAMRREDRCATPGAKDTLW